MCTNEAICGLMLDALRRGILASHGLPEKKTLNAREEISLIEQKKRAMLLIGQLSTAHKLQVLCAIVHIAGFEAIGAHNNGCLVDITDWDAGRVTRLLEIMQYYIAK